MAEVDDQHEVKKRPAGHQGHPAGRKQTDHGIVWRTAKMERIAVVNPDDVTVEQWERCFRGEATIELPDRHHDR